MFMGHDATAALGRVVGGAELARHAAGLARVDGEHVPVERPTGGSRHAGEQVDLVVAELVEAAVGHALERGPLVPTDHVAQRQQLVAVRPTRCHRLAVTVGVGAAERGGEAEAAGFDRLGEHLLHRGELLG
jgi:hypothetical protein